MAIAGSQCCTALWARYETYVQKRIEYFKKCVILTKLVAKDFLKFEIFVNLA